MSGAADRVLAPRNSTTQAGKIGVLALAAGVASTAQDCLPFGQSERVFLSFRCDVAWYVCFGDVLANVNAPVLANTGWLAAGASDGRCFGPIAAGEEWNREIGPESRYMRAFAAVAGTLRVYQSSTTPQGALPA